MKIILYSPHRQINEIIKELKTNKRVICINTNNWKFIPIKSKYKLKFTIIKLILNVLRPSIILTANWISRYDAFYSLWTKQNKYCKFIVVQHGGYVGGVVTVNSHKYIRSDVFLTWGEHFQKYFKELNSKKAISIVNFGNPIYNGIQRDNFKYDTKELKNVLIINSGVTNKGLTNLKALVSWLQKQGYIIAVKPHAHQEKKFIPLSLSNVNIIVGNTNKDLLRSDAYDLIIADHSTSLVDAIFFKKKVLFFPQYDRGTVFHKNVYSKFLKPLEVPQLLALSKSKDLNSLVDISGQESLFKALITVRENNLVAPFDL